MQLVHRIEKSLEGVFSGLPKLPQGTRDGLVKIWPILALILGVLQLFAAWGLWELATRTDRIYGVLSPYFDSATLGMTSSERFIVYASVAVVAISGAIMLMAFSGLQKRAKKGWDLLFLSAIINAIYSVLILFVDSYGFGSFISSMLGTLIGLYLLFQIRDSYSTSK